MMVHAENSSDGLVLLFRRTGATVCFLFGFGLLGVVMAGNAGAEDRPGDEEPTGPTTGLLSPLTGVVGSVLDPVVSVAAPVAEVVEPITAPITEPITNPASHPAVPAVGDPAATDVPGGPPSHVARPPVAADPPAAGTKRTVSPQPVPQRPTQPPPSWGGPVPPAAVSEVARRPGGSHRDGRHVSAALDQPAGLSGPGDPGGTPPVLVGPVTALLGGNGSAGGSGGSHAPDAAVLVPGSVPGAGDRGGRSPPKSVDGQSWFGYDARDRPS